MRASNAPKHAPSVQTNVTAPTAMTLFSKERFDFDLIAQRVGDYDNVEDESYMVPEAAK